MGISRRVCEYFEMETRFAMNNSTLDRKIGRFAWALTPKNDGSQLVALNA